MFCLDGLKEFDAFGNDSLEVGFIFGLDHHGRSPLLEWEEEI